MFLDLHKKIEDLLPAVEEQDQYSKPNCLLLHGIPEKKQKKILAHCVSKE